MKGILELELEAVDGKESGDNTNLMLVDTLNLAFRFKHRGQTDFASDLLSTVSSLGRSYNAKHIVFLTDFGSSKYRKSLDENYKDRSDKYANQTEEEKLKVKQFFEGFEKALELCSQSYPLLKLKGVEADDLAAFIVKNCSDNYEHTWLISTDADWDQLLSDKVSRFSFVTRREYTVNNFYEEHGCDTPEQYTCLKVLMGDSGDNVTGISGVGVKRGYNLLRTHGTALDLYSSLPLPGNQVLIQHINSSGDLILKNYHLMDLLTFCEEAIDYPNENNTQEVIKFCQTNNLMS